MDSQPAQSLWPKLKRFFFEYVFQWSDVRSAFVGAAFGFIASWVGNAWAASQQKHYASFMNDQGFAVPLVTLMHLVDRDRHKVSVKFEPDSLRTMRVCEFSQVAGKTGRELLESYIDRYSMCLVAYEGNDSSSITIKPNRRSDQLSESGGVFTCKCSP